MPGMFNNSCANGPQGVSQTDSPIEQGCIRPSGVLMGLNMLIGMLSPTSTLRQHLMLPMKWHSSFKPAGVCLLLQFWQELFLDDALTW